MGRCGPAEPQIAACHSQRLVKADPLAQDLVGKAVGQLGALLHHNVAVGVGQQALIAGRLGELPLQQADHKDGIGLGQAHTARRGHDHAVKALGDMPHIGRAQQQRKKLGVLGRGQLFTAQQAGKLVKQPHNDIPFAQDLIRLGQAALCAQLLCKALKRLLSPEGLQKQEDLFGQCRCGGTCPPWAQSPPAAP